MKYILITGGNAGIGKATAVALAKNGSKVILACRNLSRGKEAVSEIKKRSSNKEIYCIQCDLASFESVRTCAASFRERYGQLDILINNAGAVSDKLQFTKDGFELHIGVNHLGHFLLTTELIDLLSASNEARIINVSSNAHFNGKINFNTFKGEIGEKKFKGMAAYAQSKLANVLFTKELARRYPSISSHSLHPGVVRTNIAQKNDNGPLWSVGWKMMKPFMLSVEKGARTSIYVAQEKEALEKNGRYFYKQKEIEPANLALDEKLAAELWAVSEQLIN